MARVEHPAPRPPLELALARPVKDIPSPGALPGGCLYEPKWDGFRVAVVRDASVSLWSRKGSDLTRIFPELAAAAMEQIPDGCVVDGEAVIWRGERLDFDALQTRMARGPRAAARLAADMPASYAAFDLLAAEDTDIRHIALAARRAVLEQLAGSWEPPLHLSPATAEEQEARQWFDDLTAAGIEGLVVKGAAQPYRGGERQWLKVKHRESVDVAVGAVTGPITAPETLIVGLPIEGELRIVGRTVPLSAAARRRLRPQLQAPRSPHPWPTSVAGSAIDRFNARRDPVDLTLVEPFVAEVSADVAMAGTSFRHAVRFLRARPDLDVDELRAPR